MLLQSAAEPAVSGGGACRIDDVCDVEGSELVSLSSAESFCVIHRDTNCMSE